VFEKPIGVRDYLPHIVRRLRLLQTQVMECMERWGYEEIMTPTLEYFDTVGAASVTSESKQFKLLDPKGKMLVLRSDMTAPIARVASSLLKDQQLPIRLSYHANVFRAPEEEAGRDAEFFQTGVELIGDVSTDADAEVVALACASLEAVGLDEFKLALGHSGFVSGLMTEVLGECDESAKLKEYLMKRNHVGYIQLVKQLQLTPNSERILLEALRLRGGVEVLDRAIQLTQSNNALLAIHQLRDICHVLEAYGVTKRILIDLTMIGDFSYYTGMTFEGYASDEAFPVCSGGRYDMLLQQFGRTAPATGFALKTNRILEVLGKQQQTKNALSNTNKVLILYDQQNRQAAIEYAQSLRAKHQLDVETGILDLEENPEVTTDMEQRFIYRGRLYQDVITFVDVKQSQ
jgi:ATP phosphoribosyltransferase regulatory subunit